MYRGLNDDQLKNPCGKAFESSHSAKYKIFISLKKHLQKIYASLYTFDKTIPDLGGGNDLFLIK